MTDRWMPKYHTQPLTEHFVSDGPKVRRFCELFMKDANGKAIKLYPWQEWLIDHLLERYPEDHPDPDKAGRLRYRQAVISVARQNGKSVIASVLGMYGLMMHMEDPFVVGLASNAKQATIVYDYTRNFIKNSDVLSSRFKTTGTRGITRLDKAGKYDIQAAKPDSLQGIPVTLCLFDEAHICKPGMWQAMVKGTTAKADGIVIAITTAGDDNSELLKSLYDRGKKAVLGDPEHERFGFFVWEAPEGAAVNDPEALLDANPSAVCGGIPVSRLLDQVAGEHPNDARRYSLNQFVAATDSTWLPMDLFYKARAESFPQPDRFKFAALDVSASMKYATITVSWKKDGIVYTETAEQCVQPSVDHLVNACMRLRKEHNVRVFVVDSKVASKVAEELKRRRIEVVSLGATESQAAANITYGLFARDSIRHDNFLTLRMQMPKAARKNLTTTGGGWAISRAHSSVEIDAVMAMVNAAYIAETYVETSAGIV